MNIFQTVYQNKKITQLLLIQKNLHFEKHQAYCSHWGWSQFIVYI